MRKGSRHRIALISAIFITTIICLTLIWSEGLELWRSLLSLEDTTSKRRLNIVDYSVFPILGEVQCVRLRTVIDDTVVCLHPIEKDIHVSRMLADTGVWEPNIVDSIISELNKCADCQFIDIGANLGVYTLTMASLGRRVIAVEPVRDNLLRLVMGIKLSRLEKNVLTIRNAISDRYEKVRFWQPKDNAGGTMVDKEENVDVNKSQVQRIGDVVSTIKLDDLLQIIDFEKAIMKIDIEGLEPRAFRAAGELFDSIHIPRVYMEWSKKGNASKELIQPMLDFFTKRGYKPYDIIIQEVALNEKSMFIMNDNDGFSNDYAADVKKQDGLRFEDTKFWPFDIVWIKRKS